MIYSMGGGVVLATASSFLYLDKMSEIPLVRFPHKQYSPIPGRNKKQKEGHTIISITKKEAKLLQKLGFHYHGMDADLLKTRNGRHYWISEKSKVKNTLCDIRSKCVNLAYGKN